MTRRHFGQLAAAAASPMAGAGLYAEALRPQFHFTPARGWTNDPNGLVFYRGEYHLFFQHNPFDTKWGNMTWGHAVSPDLVHWRQLPSAIEPDQGGTIFSGSAVVDEENTSGLASGPEKVLVALYTYAGKPFTQCLAYSNDRGRTWTRYRGNPVVPHLAGSNRDPKVVWYAPSRRWIMTLFLDGNTYRFLASRDLIHWETLHDITVPGAAECPDFFEMPVAGEAGATRWVWTAANDRYLVGSFDGTRFVPEVMTQQGHYGSNYYAVQTYSGLPPARRIQIGWMQGGKYPGMPFNQQMSFPYALELRRFGRSLKLCAEPVSQIQSLYAGSRKWSDLLVKPGENPLADLTGDLWDVRAEIEPGSAAAVGFEIRGHSVSCLPGEKRLVNGEASAPLSLSSGRVRLRILVDRTSVEVFANDGEVVMPCCFLPLAENQSLSFFARGAAARVISLEVHPLQPAW